MNPIGISKKRSLGALFAGLLATAIPPTLVDALLHAAGVFPPVGDGYFALALAYRILFTVAGAYVTARIASERPMRHVVTLGAVGMIFGTIGLLATWNRGPEFGPKWYPLALIVLAIPCTWVGAKLLSAAAIPVPKGLSTSAPQD